MDNGEITRCGGPRLEPIDVEFEPMYALTHRDHEVLINSLFNLVVELLNQFSDFSDSRAQKDLAERAGQILSDYDEDLGEVLSRFAITMRTDDSETADSS